MIELIKYTIGLSVCFDIKPKRFWIGMIGAFIFLIFTLSVSNDAVFAHAIMLILVLITLFLSVSGLWYQRIAYLIVLLFLITSIDSLCNIPSFIYQKYDLSEWMISYVGYLVSSSLCLLILMIVHQMRKYERVRTFFSKGILIYSIIGIMGISVLLNIAALNSMLPSIQNSRFYVFCKIIITIAYGGVAFLGWLMVYIKKINEKVSMNLETERRMKAIQTEYYQVLLEKEEETRKFRHDMNNHLNCLSVLLEKGSLEEVCSYITDMRGEMRTIQQKCYQTGNDIIDAILNYHLLEVKELVDVQVTGHCPAQIAVNDMELCTIVANLVQNAVEAIKRSDNIQRYIHIKIISGSNYVNFQIANNMDDVLVVSKKHLPVTRKEDKRNHGLGLKNVRNTVEKNSGIFELKNEQDRFEVRIILPLCAK